MSIVSNMTRGLIALMLALGSLCFTAQPAQAATGCVTRAEYRQVHKGYSKTRVARIFGTGGQRQVFVTSGGFTSEMRDYRTATRDPATAASTGTPRSDDAVIAQLGRYPRAYNAASRAFWSAYADDSISDRRFLKASKKQAASMRAAVDGFRVQVAMIANPRLRAAFQRVVANYAAKLKAVNLMRESVGRGDIDGQDEASYLIRRSGGRALDTDLLHRLRPLLTAKQYARFARAAAGT